VSDPLASLAEQQGKDILENLRNLIEDDWDNLPDEKKEAIQTIAVKIPEFRLRLLVDPENADLKAKLETYESAAADWKVWAELEGEKLHNAFWEGVARAAAAFGAFLGAAAGEFAGRTFPGLDSA